MDCSLPGFPLLHYFPEFAQTHVWVSDTHPTISSSVVSFFSCPQSFPASGSVPMSQFFASGGQSIGASASASVLPVNIQGWSPLGWTGWISLQSKEPSEQCPMSIQPPPQETPDLQGKPAPLQRNNHTQQTEAVPGRRFTEPAEQISRPCIPNIPRKMQAMWAQPMEI